MITYTVFFPEHRTEVFPRRCNLHQPAKIFGLCHASLEQALRLALECIADSLLHVQVPKYPSKVSMAALSSTCKGNKEDSLKHQGTVAAIQSYFKRKPPEA